MGMIILSVICTFIAYLVGVVIENTPSVNVPGLGIVLALVTMGSFIMYKIDKVKKQ